MSTAEPAARPLRAGGWLQCPPVLPPQGGPASSSSGMTRGRAPDPSRNQSAAPTRGLPPSPTPSPAGSGCYRLAPSRPPRSLPQRPLGTDSCFPERMTLRPSSQDAQGGTARLLCCLFSINKQLSSVGRLVPASPMGWGRGIYKVLGGVGVRDVMFTNRNLGRGGGGGGGHSLGRRCVYGGGRGGRTGYFLLSSSGSVTRVQRHGGGGAYPSR